MVEQPRAFIVVFWGAGYALVRTLWPHRACVGFVQGYLAGVVLIKQSLSFCVFLHVSLKKYVLKPVQERQEFWQTVVKVRIVWNARRAVPKWV